MIPFIILFLAIYGSMHGYAFWRLWTAYPHMPSWGRAALAGWLVMMAAAPILIHYLDKWRFFRLADVAGVIGYCWMAVILWFVVGMLAVDGFNLLVHGAALAAPGAKSALVPYRLAVNVLGVLIVIALAVGLYQARNIRVRELSLEVKGWAGDHQPVRLVQISDVHLGVLMHQGRLGPIVEKLRELRPDVLISTGDLVDASMDAIEPLAEVLAAVPTPLGKLAVLGNHEYYAGLEDSLKFHQRAGFTVLRGESIRLEDGIFIAGVDDPAGLTMHRSDFLNEQAALAGSEGANVVILLKHQPRVRAESVGKFNLQLSGHTHGGQIFPFHLLTRSFYPLYRGWTNLPEGSAIYASFGTGTWGPPVRLFAQPEIVVFTLRPGKD